MRKGRKKAVKAYEFFWLRVGGTIARVLGQISNSIRSTGGGDGQKFLLSTIVETDAAAPLTVVVNWTAEAKRY